MKTVFHFIIAQFHETFCQYFNIAVLAYFLCPECLPPVLLASKGSCLSHVGDLTCKYIFSNIVCSAIKDILKFILMYLTSPSCSCSK